MNEYFRRTWAEIDLDALKYNYESISSICSPGTKMMCVVKADAYGHGVDATVREFTSLGCEWFAVSNLEEALQVRKINSDCSILILGYTPAEYADVLAINNISQSLFNEEYAKQLSAIASEKGVEISCHIKVDTGMSRLGFIFHDAVNDISSVDQVLRSCSLPGIYAEGIFTHFASADEGENGIVFTTLQYDLFKTFIGCLEFQGLKIPYRHCCNSAATILHPEMHLDIVRPGIILYGLNPSSHLSGQIDLKPVMSIKSVISMVKTIPEDTPLSYGRKYITKKESKVATIPIGYADGYPRTLSGNISVRIGSTFVPVIGTICMDQCMVDVSDIPDAQEGMCVTIIDNDPSSPISFDVLAEKLGTINYELVCNINKRVPRVYLRSGEADCVTDYNKLV